MFTKKRGIPKSITVAQRRAHDRTKNPISYDASRKCKSLGEFDEDEEFNEDEEEE